MKTFRTILITATAIAALPVTAHAYQGRGHGKNYNASVERAADYRRDNDRRRYTSLGSYERGIVRDYYGNGRNCPPGLAKKRNGCLPPGIAKKRYSVGSRLGRNVDVRELPYDLRRQLPILPRDYGYRMVDGDLAVVELATLIVLDAVGLY